MREQLQTRPTRRRFRRAPGEKRARIIAVARACFAERPYEETTTAEIASRAGVSEGTVFHHFGTKLELLRQVAEDYARDLVEAMLDGADRSFLRVDAALARAYRFVEQEGVLGMEPKRRASNPQPLMIVHRAIRDAIVARAAEVLESWQAQGVVRPMNSSLVAEILFPIIDSMLVKAFMYGKKQVSQEYMEEAMRCIEGALSFNPPKH